LTEEPTIRWNARENVFDLPHTGGHVGLSGLDRDRQGFGRLSRVADVPLASLKRAMASAARFFDRIDEEYASKGRDKAGRDHWWTHQLDPDLFEWPDDRFSFTWPEYDDDNFEEESSLPAQHELAILDDSDLVLRTIIAKDASDAAFAREPLHGPGLRPADLPDWPSGRAATEVWLRTRGLTMRAFDPVGSDPYFGDIWLVTASIPTRNRTISQAAAQGNDLNRFVRTLGAGGAPEPEAARALLLGGHAEALIGIQENQTFEAKRFIRFDDGDAWEHAKDAAAFANSDHGGVIVYGLTTRRRRGRDVVHGTSPFAANSQDRRIQRELDRLIVPPIEALQTALVPAGGGDEVLLMVYVPPQPPELRPFLVQGAIVDGRLAGTAIALYRRREDDVVANSAAALHAALAAGLALLRSASHDPAHGRAGSRRLPPADDEKL
jgi:hypothetical protein